jgi:hypothetical protein
MLRRRLPAFRRGRNAPWMKRARCGIALPDVTDRQYTGRDGPLAPPAQCRPEHRPALGPTEPLWGAAPPRPKWPLTPLAHGRGSSHHHESLGSAASISRPASSVAPTHRVRWRRRRCRSSAHQPLANRFRRTSDGCHATGQPDISLPLAVTAHPGECGNGRFKLGYSDPVRIPPSHGARYLQLHYEKTTGTASLSFQSSLILVSVKLDYGSQGLLPTRHICWTS